MRLSTRTLAALIAAGAGLVAAVVVLLVVVLGGDDAGGRDGAASSASAPISGCSEATTEELYVQHAYTCPDGTRVLTFATMQARDDYLKVAEGFGAVATDKGATWVRLRA
jgi:hypothetical protein